jgi:hypothetical protein
MGGTGGMAGKLGGPANKFQLLAALAQRLDLTRAELIARGLRAVLAVEGEG